MDRSELDFWDRITLDLSVFDQPNSFQKRTDFMQLMMNAHKEPNEQQEHDTEFNEMYKGTTRRSK